MKKQQAGGNGLRALSRSVACNDPRFQERCHPSDQNTRGLEDMTDASLQRGLQGRCEEADEAASAAERCPDFSRTGHSRGQPLQLEEGLAVAGRGGAGIREGTRGLVCCRQIHGGAGDRRAQCHGAQRLLPGARPVHGAGGTVEAGRPGCQRKASADLERAEGAKEAPYPGPAGDQCAQKGAAA